METALDLSWKHDVIMVCASCIFKIWLLCFRILSIKLVLSYKKQQDKLSEWISKAIGTPMVLLCVYIVNRSSFLYNYRIFVFIKFFAIFIFYSCVYVLLLYSYRICVLMWLLCFLTNKLQCKAINSQLNHLTFAVHIVEL